jgi:hypothetical protein
LLKLVSAPASLSVSIRQLVGEAELFVLQKRFAFAQSGTCTALDGTGRMDGALVCLGGRGALPHEGAALSWASPLLRAKKEKRKEKKEKRKKT